MSANKLDVVESTRSRDGSSEAHSEDCKGAVQDLAVTMLNASRKFKAWASDTNRWEDVEIVRFFTIENKRGCVVRSSDPDVDDWEVPDTASFIRYTYKT